MASSWEKYEELIKAEMKKVYSETTIEHAMKPRNIGDMGECRRLYQGDWPLR